MRLNRINLKFFTKILLTSIAFISGFLTHALFFPDFLANGITDIRQIVIPNPTPAGTASNTQAFETKITFDGTHFSRHNITNGVGNYLMIINIAQHNAMWLISNDPQLATPRGYGESEQVRERMDTRGQFVVEDKNNPQERLIVIVK